MIWHHFRVKLNPAPNFHAVTEYEKWSLWVRPKNEHIIVSFFLDTGRIYSCVEVWLIGAQALSVGSLKKTSDTDILELLENTLCLFSHFYQDEDRPLFSHACRWITQQLGYQRAKHIHELISLWPVNK